MNTIIDLIKKIVVGILILIISIKAYSSVIVVKDTVKSNTTWTADTVRVTGNIVVPSGITLTISPKTYVKLCGYYSFSIDGAILAIGSSDSITFGMGHKTTDTSGFYNLNITNGGWKGIFIKSTGTIIEKCRIMHIKRSKADGATYKTGIAITGKKTVISGNNFNTNITETAVIRAMNTSTRG